MNKAHSLNVSENLDFMRRLKETVAQFARAEAELTQELGARRFALARAHRNALDQLQSGFAAQSATVRDRAEADTERTTALYESRQTRIEKFHSNREWDLPHRAQREKEAWLGNLQMRHFHAQTQRSASLGEAEAQSHTALRAVAEEHAHLQKLLQKTKQTFRGYGRFSGKLRRTQNATANVEAVPESSLQALQQANSDAESALELFRAQPIPTVLRYLPLWVLAPFGAVATAALMPGPLPQKLAYAALGGIVFGLPLLVYSYPGKLAESAAEALISSLAQARTLCALEEQRIHETLKKQKREIEENYARVHAEIDALWKTADQRESDFSERTRARLETAVPRATARNEAQHTARLQRIAAAQAVDLGVIAAAEAEQIAALNASHEAAMTQWKADEAHGWGELTAAWEAAIRPLYATLEERNALVKTWFPTWTPQLVEAWKPARDFIPATSFGSVELDLAQVGLPKDPRLALPGGKLDSTSLSIPLALGYPAEGSLLFETGTTAAATPEVVAVLNQIILRLLATTPPGKVSFTIIDPVGLGENFAGLMQLADDEEALINRRIWTQRDQIDERLGELCEHIEKVIQMYLRNQYETITEYNEQAGSVAEKYHFLVVADFPAAFSETAAERLQSIVTSGARCGVFTLLHWDKNQSLPGGFVPDELRKNSVRLWRENGPWRINAVAPEPAQTVALEPMPPTELAMELTRKIGKASVDSNRVEVPFAQIAPAAGELWKTETAQELRIAIGRTGATKHQFLSIGKGTRQHALVAGKTGSGKSTLFHVIITNLALACSPHEVEFYLIDFKKGVEFKCYAEKRLPHAKVVAIESDREFALSVLERVDEELKRRGDLFRKLGAQDVAGYKKAGGTEPIPRLLLIIDEFQEFFVDDDAVAQSASLYLDRIVRQGRAFGIHALLGSQTLGGAYSLARATLGQMAIRIALQCNEADAYLIMDETNAAPRLLSRPGEGIYNDAAGAIEGNSPFQVVWLPDEERDGWLQKVRSLAEARPELDSRPIVFEGNAPAEVAENELLAEELASFQARSGKGVAATTSQKTPLKAPPIGRIWLGAPNSIKGPTEAPLQPQSGSNLLIIGQREESTLTMMALSLLSLAAQYPAGSAQFYLFHSATPGLDADVLQTVAELLKQSGHKITVAGGLDVAPAVAALSETLKARQSGNADSISLGEASSEANSDGSQPQDAPSTAPSATPFTGPVFCFVQGLQKFKKLKPADEFAFSMSDSGPDAGAQFGELITEGSPHGIHLIVSLDTLNNVNRFLSRKALSEFEMRVAFQMSANDSASLLDTPKASNLGLHRALYYNEHAGTLETFRPYAEPSAEWLRQAQRLMK